MRLKLMFLLLPLAAPAAAHAEGEPCRVVRYERHKFVRIKSRLHHGTHIELPEALIARPVTGNRDLWDVEGEDRHIFVKPNDPGTEEGSSTTVTAVSRGNNAYHFLVERSAADFDLCVVVTHDGEFLPENAFGGFARQEAQEEARQRRRVARLQEQVQRQAGAAAEQAAAALDEYRTHLFTGYDWQGGRAPYDRRLVSDVYDDGRFTYIRTRHNLGGVLSLMADSHGQEQFIEYRYDEARRLYVVTGIYDRIYMKADNKTQIVISRRRDPEPRREW